EIPQVQEMLALGNGVWLKGENFILLSVTRCQNTEDVGQFIDKLASLPLQEAELIWNEFKENNYLAMLLIDRAWLAESKEETPNWEKCIEILNRASEAASEHKADSLAAAAHRAKSIVLEEYLENTIDAFAVLESGEAKLGRKHVVLEDYRAKILAREQRNKEAIDLW